jgi:hypothetical protein
MNAHATKLGIKGRVKIEVADHRGNIILSRPWQKNLLLDQGLNNFADRHLAELFEYAAAGTGTTATKETVAGSNSFTLTGTTLTRTAGTRDFTVADIGKLVRRADSPFTEAIITAVGGVTSVSVRDVGLSSLADYTDKDIILYSVHQVGLDAELGARTNEYGAVTGDNSTVSASNVRTLKRTFIFPAVPEQKEEVSVDDPTASYSQSAGTVTQLSGGRDFTSADVGKYIYWTVGETLSKITGVLDFTPGATQVSVTPSDTVGPQAIDLYGFVSYGEVGFSHTGTAGNNLNVRVRIEDGGGVSDPVVVEGENPLTPGQQLRLVYEVEIAVTPEVSTPGTAFISDPGSAMSSNKNGDYVIEHVALSAVDTNGGTNLDYTTLEPATAGQAGLTPATGPLVPLDGPDRSTGSFGVDLVADDYVADSFTRTYEGMFGINDAVSNSWRNLGLYDPTSETFPFVFHFDTSQVKTAEFSIVVRFQKTWGRDLS